MTDRSPGTYFFSAVLHAAIVGLALVLTYVVGQQVPEVPKVFELVAGAGDNYAATAAPALGDLGGIKLKVPAPPAPEPSAALQPVASEPAPLQAETSPQSKTAKPTNFTKVLDRAAARRESRIMTKYKKQLEAEEKRQRLTEEQFRKAHPNVALATSSSVTHIDAEGIREGVLGGSTENKTGGAGGNALTREEGDEIEAYFALLVNRLKETFDTLKPADAGDQLTAKVAFYVAADGSLSRVRITRSSGNSEFDQAVMETFSQTASIGPRPDHRGEDVSVEFKMREETTPNG
jgi:colicin import membrane protein